MIIWSGRGVLIPIIAIAGGAFGVILSLNLASMAKSSPTATGCFWAAVLLLLFGLTLGKATRQLSVDPRTQRQVTVELKHTFFFLNANMWAVVAGTCFFILAALNLASQPGFSQAVSRSAFSKADDLLVGRSKGVVHGNTNEAEALAKQFSIQLKMARRAGIEGRKSDSVFSTTGGEFLTYCLLTPKRCVFLVHVPELRKFSNDAKDFIAEAAWMVAVSLVKDRSVEKQILAVGIRGSLFYDRVLAGSLENESRMPGAATGNDESRRYLTDLFKAAEQDLIVEPVASGPQDKAQGHPIVDEVSEPVASAKASPEVSPAGLPSGPTRMKKSEQAVEPSSQTPVARVRDWKDANGRPLRAAFVRFMDDDRKEAEFQREDGQFFVIPLDRFSEADREYLNRLPAF